MRSTPAPRAEKLETLIEFGLSVQSLCDHLEAAGQQSHLTNPYLLMELVEKLPAHIKMNWANYMQQFPMVNLKNFGDFMSSMVTSATKVTMYSGGFRKREDADLGMKSKGSPHASCSIPEILNDDTICCVCEDSGHLVQECDRFKELSIDHRWKTVKLNALCRSCLQSHVGRNCRNISECGISGCTSRHHPLLHANHANPRILERAGNHTHRSQNNPKNPLLFRVVPVTLSGPQKTIKTYAFLDDGSHLTLIEEALTKELGVKGKTVPLCLSWTADVSRIESDSMQLQLSITGADNERLLKLDDVRTVKNLSIPGQTLRVNELAAKLAI